VAFVGVPEGDPERKEMAVNRNIVKQKQCKVCFLVVDEEVRELREKKNRDMKNGPKKKRGLKLESFLVLEVRQRTHVFKYFSSCLCDRGQRAGHGSFLLSSISWST
jgi:hypothetical protein